MPVDFVVGRHSTTTFYSMDVTMKPVSLITALLLLLVAAAHLLRFVLQVEIAIGESVMPMWPSIPACIVPAALAFGLWRESRS